MLMLDDVSVRMVFFGTLAGVLMVEKSEMIHDII